MPGARIGFILPTVLIARRAKKIAAELDMHDIVACQVGNHMKGLEIAKQFEAEGIEVLISRRSTADLIKEHLQTPNVLINITLQDIAQALADAQKITGLLRPRIGLFAMPSDEANIESFAKLLNFDLHLYTVTPNEEYLELMVQRAIADKMDIIAAGAVVTKFANQYNFPSLLLDCGTVALRTALLDAEKVAYARQLEKIRAENFRIVVEKSNRGILVLDGAGFVKMANPTARAILGSNVISDSSNIEELLPELQLKGKDLKHTQVTGMFLTSVKGPLVIDITPVNVTQTAHEVVLTFQLAEALSEISAITKKNLYSERFINNYSFADIIGESAEITGTKQTAREYAASNASILIVGETGTGKELFAHAIHEASNYRCGPFIAVNCAALPSSLLESELFGFEEGAFTGATRKGKPGLFEMAHQGTIFLDEISELNKQSQMRLLRVLQERQVMRLGGTKLISFDTRFISATNKDLWRLVQNGRFREDLYYRLCMLPLFVPPLRNRNEDIGLLITHLIQGEYQKRGRKIRLRKEIIKHLEQHHWPGNVRELFNLMERIFVAAKKGVLRTEQVEHLLTPEKWWSNAMNTSRAQTQPKLSASNYLERDEIIKALEQCSGHRGKASALLGINRSTLFRKMSVYGIKTMSH